MLLNLGFLGLNIFLSLFEIAIGKDNFSRSAEKINHYNFSVGNLVDISNKLPLEGLKKDKNEATSITIPFLNPLIEKIKSNDNKIKSTKFTLLK